MAEQQRIEPEIESTLAGTLEFTEHDAAIHLRRFYRALRKYYIVITLAPEDLCIIF
jgi:hypothetical protein